MTQWEQEKIAANKRRLAERLKDRRDFRLTLGEKKTSLSAKIKEVDDEIERIEKEMSE